MSESTADELEQLRKGLQATPALRPVAPYFGPLWKEDRTTVLMILESHTDIVTGNIEAGSIHDLSVDLITYCAHLREALGGGET